MMLTIEKNEKDTGILLPNGPATDAADRLFRLVADFQYHDIRKQFPEDTLHLGNLRENGRSVGHRIVNATTRRENRRYIEGNTHEVIDRITNMQEHTPLNLCKIGLIVISFFLHNLENDTERKQFMENIAKKFPDAAIIVADYTAKKFSGQEAREILTAKVERNAMQLKGEDRFIREHNVFTLESLQACLSDSYAHTIAQSLAKGRGVVIGSPKALNAFTSPSLVTQHEG